MARRRSGSAGWTTKAVRGPLWKYVHPVKYLGSEARKARYHMRPDRVVWRVFGTGRAKPTLKTKTTRVTAATRQIDVARAAKKAAAAKKSTAKRPDPYAAALAIPGQNRQIAAKQAKAAQPAKKTAAGRTPRKSAAKTVVPVRNPDGTFNGSTAVPTFDAAAQEANRRAWTGYVDPSLLPKSARTRKR